MLERDEVFRVRSFELARARNDIDHRPAKPMHPSHLLHPPRSDTPR